MDWSICIISQSKIREETVSTNKGKLFFGRDVFENFLCNVKEFRNLEALPCSISFDDSYTADTFIANNARWYKSCHQRFNIDMLQRQARETKDRL